MSLVPYRLAVHLLKLWLSAAQAWTEHLSCQKRRQARTLPIPHFLAPHFLALRLADARAWTQQSSYHRLFRLVQVRQVS